LIKKLNKKFQYPIQVIPNYPISQTGLAIFYFGNWIFCLALGFL